MTKDKKVLTPKEFIDQAKTPDERAKRKAIMFPFLYSIQPSTITKNINITEKQAQELIKDFEDNLKKEVK